MTHNTNSSPQEQRNWFLWGWLALIILNNLFTIVSFLTGGSNPLAYIANPDDNTLFNSPAILIVNIASAVAILFAVLTMLNYRIGYYGLVLSFIVMTVASLTLGFNIGMVLLTGLVALITWVLLRPSWDSMK